MPLSAILNDLGTTPLDACRDIRAVLKVIKAADAALANTGIDLDWRRKNQGPKAIQGYVSIEHLGHEWNLRSDHPVIDQIDDVQEMIDEQWLKKLRRVEALFQGMVTHEGFVGQTAIYFDEALSDWSPRAMEACVGTISGFPVAQHGSAGDTLRKDVALETYDYRLLKIISKRQRQSLTLTQWREVCNVAGIGGTEKTISKHIKHLLKNKLLQRPPLKDGQSSKRGLMVTINGMNVLASWKDPKPKEVNIQ